MFKIYTTPTPVNKNWLSRVLKEGRDDNVSEVLELGVAFRSAGEIFPDFRAVFIPVHNDQSHEEIRRKIAQTQCASDWVVSIRKAHPIKKEPIKEFFSPVMRLLSLTN